MAQNSADGVTWFLSLPAEHYDVLGSIRHWTNLKIAFEGNVVWVKDLTVVQVESADVKIIPYKEIFYSRGAKLFPYGSDLPSGNVPSLLWSPIERGIQVTLPAFNHNYFGVNETVNAKLVRTDCEEKAGALLVGINTLKKYLESAPAVRLERLEWVLLGQQVLLTGTPLLPVDGQGLWKRGEHLLPAGYDFEFPVLADAYARLLDPERKSLLVWTEQSACSVISKDDIRPFSLSSFRNTYAS